jgi:hypothetical protein
MRVHLFDPSAFTSVSTDVLQTAQQPQEAPPRHLAFTLPGQNAIDMPGLKSATTIEQSFVQH